MSGIIRHMLSVFIYTHPRLCNWGVRWVNCEILGSVAYICIKMCILVTTLDFHKMAEVSYVCVYIYIYIEYRWKLLAGLTVSDGVSPALCGCQGSPNWSGITIYRCRMWHACLLNFSKGYSRFKIPLLSHQRNENVAEH